MVVTMNLINENYTKNLEYYSKMTAKVSNSLDGRICHHKVVVLNIIAELLNAQTYLEIGVHNGTSMSYASFERSDMQCIGIDLFENTISRYRHDRLQYDRTLANISKINNTKENICLLKGNSFYPEIVNKVAEKIQDRKIDLLFIDGDHSYNGIKSDFINYTPFLRKGGIIVIDDYNQMYPEILKFCKEINFEEFEQIGVFQDNELILRKRVK